MFIKTLTALAATFLVSSPALAQRVNIANLSSGAQLRWAKVSLPRAYADPLPVLCRYDQGNGAGFFAVRGRAIGEMCRLYYVLTNMPGDGGGSGSIVPIGSLPQVSWPVSPWVTDDLSKMVLNLHVVRAGQRTVMPFLPVELVENSHVAKTFRLFAGPVRGIWGEVFVTFHPFQDVVEIEGHFGWSDPNDSAWSTDLDSVELTMGEELHLHFASRSGFQPIPGGWQLFSNAQMWNGMFPHGMAPHFYGVILPRPDVPQSGTAQQVQRRLAMLDAAKEGPVLMTGDDAIWDGHWFAFGATPKVPPGVDGLAEANLRAANFKGYLQGQGGFWDERPLANRFNTGAPGAQAPFGASKGTLAVTVGDPRFIWEMLYSSTDYGVRAFHAREADGSRVLAANHPNWVTVSGYADPRFSSDLLGKSPTRPYSWNLGRHGPNGQHRGQNYMWAAWALTGSWLLEDVALDLIETDSTARGPSTNPSAPRSLRTQQDLAKIYGLVSDAATRQRIVTMMEWALTSWENGWTGGSVTGPVKPLEDASPDARVLCCGLPFHVPWNESLGMMGLLESRALMRKIGNTGLQTRYENLIRPVARTAMLYGTARDSTGLLFPLNGVAWLPNGQVQPASYYDLSRPGASFTVGSTVDLLIGSQGWYWWWSGAVHGALFLSPVGSPEWLIADEIKRVYLQPARIDKAEWIAVGSR